MAEFSAPQGVSRPWRRALLIGGVIALLIFWQPVSRLLWQIALAGLLTAAALPLEKAMEKRLPRGLAAAAAVGALVLAAAGAVLVIVPRLIEQISLVIAQAPRLLAWAQALWEKISQLEWVQTLQLDADAPAQWLAQAGAWAAERLPGVLAGVGGAADALSRAFLAPFLSYYFLRDREAFTYRLSLWIPLRQRRRALTALREMRREAGGYVRGQLLVAAAVAALTALGLLLVGLPAWLALGLLMGACELIPYVGPLIGGVPIVLFALPMGLPATLWALGVTIAVQQLEGYFLSPRLMAGATGLHPVYVMLLLSAGGLLGGLAGMILALPAFVCLRGAFRVLRG